MAELYWIHLPEHTDISSQGYIGITSKTSIVRFKEHIRSAKRTDTKHYTITKAIKKYKDQLICKTLVICSLDYAKILEEKLRPSECIGWNMAVGGQIPNRYFGVYGDEWKEKLRQCNLGKKHSKETLEKISIISKHSYSVNREKCITNQLHRRVSKPPYSGTSRPWIHGKSGKLTNFQIFKKAQQIVDIYWKANEVISTSEIMSKVDIDEFHINTVVKMLPMVRGGWVPIEDPLWLKYFNGEENPC